MSGRLIDAHCHLDFEVFDEDRDEVMRRARDAGVAHIVVPGVDIDNWSRISALCNADDSLSACYGLHPYRCSHHREQHLQELRDIAATSSCVAIGECGLDFRDGMADPQLQQSYFDAQLGIAVELGKPVVIHSVRATEQVIATLKHHRGLRGMVHSYSGSYEQAMLLHDMGFLLSFGGAITHDRARRLRDSVSRLPLAAMMIETDAPDQPGAAHRGERNEPGYITEVFDAVCALRSEDAEHIADALYANTVELFSLNVAH